MAGGDASGLYLDYKSGSLHRVEGSRENFGWSFHTGAECLIK